MVDRPTDHLQHGSGSLQIADVAAAEHAQSAGFRAFGSAGHRGIDELHLPLGEPISHRSGGGRADGRAVDHQASGGQCRPCALLTPQHRLHCVVVADAQQQRFAADHGCRGSAGRGGANQGCIGLGRTAAGVNAQVVAGGLQVGRHG